MEVGTEILHAHLTGKVHPCSYTHPGGGFELAISWLIVQRPIRYSFDFAVLNAERILFKGVEKSLDRA
jgi:hypothetical protein